MNVDVSWSSAGGWIARWAAGAVLGQIVFGPTTMLFLALITGAALGAGAMYLLRRRPRHPRAARSRVRVSRPRAPRPRAPRLCVARLRVPRLRVPPLRVPPLRVPPLRVPRRFVALASRSWRAFRRPAGAGPEPHGPRFSPRAPKRAYSPLAPR